MIGNVGPGCWPGDESPDESFDFVGRLTPIDLTVFFGKFGEISFLRVVLRGQKMRVLDIGFEDGI